MMTLTPPHDVAAERALLGAALIDPQAASELAWVEPGLFYLPRHAWVWEAIASLRRDGLEVDYITVLNRLDSAGRLAEAGGPGYLARLITDTPSSAHAEAYARIVARESGGRP